MPSSRFKMKIFRSMAKRMDGDYNPLISSPQLAIFLIFEQMKSHVNFINSSWSVNTQW